MGAGKRLLCKRWKIYNVLQVLKDTPTPQVMKLLTVELKTTAHNNAFDGSLDMVWDDLSSHHIKPQRMGMNRTKG